MSDVRLITSHLGEHIIRQMEKSSTVYILTSFVMKSGVQFIKESLQRTLQSCADIKICTGDYLFITQPEALRELMNISEKIEIRVWKSNGVSFHPKAYLFQDETRDCLFVGSSNLSRSALTNGVEWNVSVSNYEEVFQDAMEQFLQIFYSEQTVPLNEVTLKEYKEQYAQFHVKNPNLTKEWSKAEELDLMLPSKVDNPPEMDVIHEASAPYGVIQPRFAQIEALEELHKTLDEDYDKALVVMATGLGKTYLAGFFAQKFRSVLFIAHREEILQQAKKSFYTIDPSRTYGIFDGKRKEDYADTIFASIYTMSSSKHLHSFRKDEFDLIIVDEFHHAAANSYKRLLEYFQPKFLLGITATPDRNDNKDVYAICDGNVAFRLDFLDAINRKWLSPFKYFGVYDDTDYSQITWLGNRYDEEELLQAQLRDEMAENILQSWVQKKQTRTLGFCSSIRQADFLATYFNNKGFRTVSLHSQQVRVGRLEAIERLAKRELDIIFTVDLFNEGVDIPSVDTLLFVRPTESLTVFTQQIGRGLRLYDTKTHCVIIDLLGNYRNADIKLSLFDTEFDRKTTKTVQPVVPELCELHLDLQVINLFKEMARKKQPRKEKLLEAYRDLKFELGRRPSYLELHLQGASESNHYRQEFHSLYGFLFWADELLEREKEVYERYKNWLVEEEKTSMTKSYKMVVLLAMLKRGQADWYKPITSTEVAPFFHQYLMEKEYRKRIDFSDRGAKKLWNYDEKGVSRLISNMPMTKWSGSSKGLISYENDRFKLKFDVLKEDEEILYTMTRDICEYRLHVHFERKGKQ